MVKKAVVHLPNVEADTFDGLLVNYVVQQKAGPLSAACGPVGL